MHTTRKGMNGAIALLLLFMTIVAAPIIGPERAYACSCAEAPDMESAMSYNDVVFAGEVTKVDMAKKFHSSADKVEVSFRVEKVWKGELAEETRLQTVRSEISCGYTFADNMSYLVFANEDEAGNLQTGLCHGNMPLSGADGMLKQLDAINQSYDPFATKLGAAAEAAPGDAVLVSDREEDGSSRTVYWLAAIAALLVLTGFVIWIARSRRRV